MSIPIRCSECGDVIGVNNTPHLSRAKYAHSKNPCPGKGKHAAPVRKELPRLFGLYRRVTQSYPETGTVSSWDEYTGPRTKRWFRLTMVLRGGTDGMVLDHKWCWWTRETGFYGDGAQELRSTT